MTPKNKTTGTIFMDTPIHIKIAKTAVDWLNGDCSIFWTPWRKQLAITAIREN
jgi:hypothetical protein